MVNGTPDAVELAIIGIVCCGCKDLNADGCQYEANHGEPLPCAPGSRCIYNPHNVAGGESRHITKEKNERTEKKTMAGRKKFEIDDARAMALYNQGKSDGKIAEALGCATQTILRWRAKNSLLPNGRGGVERLEQELFEKAQKAQTARVGSYCPANVETERQETIVFASGGRYETLKKQLHKLGESPSWSAEMEAKAEKIYCEMEEIRQGYKAVGCILTDDMPEAALPQEGAAELPPEIKKQVDDCLKQAKEREELMLEAPAVDQESKPTATGLLCNANVVKANDVRATDNKLLSLLNQLCTEHPGAEITVDGLKVASVSVYVEYELDGARRFPKICLLTESSGMYVD